MLPSVWGRLTSSSVRGLLVFEGCRGVDWLIDCYFSETFDWVGAM
jgi:hypothetical protein